MGYSCKYCLKMHDSKHKIKKCQIRRFVKLKSDTALCHFLQNSDLNAKNIDPNHELNQQTPRLCSEPIKLSCSQQKSESAFFQLLDRKQRTKFIIDKFQRKKVGRAYLCESIGSGSFGVVFSGIFNQKKVAIKAIDKNDCSQREIECLKLIRGDHIAKFITHFEMQGFYFVVMDLYHGNLNEYFRNVGFSEQLLLHALKEILKGINELKSYDIVHEDIHSKNILFKVLPRRLYPSFFLCDFSLVNRTNNKNKNIDLMFFLHLMAKYSLFSQPEFFEMFPSRSRCVKSEKKQLLQFRNQYPAWVASCLEDYFIKGCREIKLMMTALEFARPASTQENLRTIEEAASNYLVQSEPEQQVEESIQNYGFKQNKTKMIKKGRVDKM